jgi:hypothetical protein
LPFFENMQAVPEEFKNEIFLQHIKIVDENEVSTFKDIRNLWRILGLIVDDWEFLCQYNR